LEKADVEKAKILLLFGYSGAGKSTLANALVNFHFGIQPYDTFRLILIDEGEKAKDQTKSITQEVKQYTIAGFGDKPPLIIIDTPGYADTRGSTQDINTDL